MKGISSYDVGCIAAALLAHAVVDFVYARHTKARWFVLHATCNFFITLLCLPDVVGTIWDPIHCGEGPYSPYPVYLVVAVHSYHMIAFSNLTWDDWFHHLLFVGVIGSAGLVFQAGPVLGLIAFILCGLPGGLDYCMLACVKHQLMDPLQEKKWNARINVWIRSPGSLGCSFCLYVAIRYGKRTFSWLEIIMAFFTAFLCILNGQYYMQRVVGNTFRKNQEYTC
mmetsp:Transcript_20748/g.49303  ORF Transcript_20748/g.49303 Transcript_20748/m.49303 type:complete len:224 (+) Transcript_20748:76-747(+)